ncbi:MAG: hypothetical protein J6Y69_02110 [Treponema sp.]|nr:hypothetical protein [Treponema sp.]
MNAKGIIDYNTVLCNLLDEATKEDKKIIKELLEVLNPVNGSVPDHAKFEADKLIRKYRPQYYEP